MSEENNLQNLESFVYTHKQVAPATSDGKVSTRRAQDIDINSKARREAGTFESTSISPASELHLAAVEANTLPLLPSSDAFRIASHLDALRCRASSAAR